MPHNCCVRGCKERFERGCCVTFHSLPLDVRRKNAWLESIGLENVGHISRYSKVCSKHFTEDSFDRTKFGGTWLKSNAVPTIFDFARKHQENQDVKYFLLMSEREIPKYPSFTTPGIGTQHHLGDLKCEDLVILQKRSTPAAQSSVASFEPEVVIKEEPIDIDENPVPSTSRTDQEFILPCTDSFQSGTTPTVAESFTVIKTEPVDEDEPKTSSNGNTTKSRKRKAAEVGQCESPANRSDEDPATKNNNAKDHFDVYGEYIAAKLRKLDWKSCAYVQKAFGDILFDAEMGKFKK